MKNRKNSVQRNDRIENMDEKMTEKRSRRRRKLLLFLLLFLMLACYAIYYLTKPSDKRIDLRADYFHIESEDEMGLVINQTVSASFAKKADGTYYFPLALVEDELDSRFYYDESRGSLLFAEPLELLEAFPDEKSYYRDGVKIECEHAPFRKFGEDWYVERSFFELSDYDVTVYDLPGYIVLFDEYEKEQNMAELEKADELREKDSVRSSIVKTLSLGDRVVILNEGEKWSQVMTIDGLSGYVKNSSLGDLYSEKVENKKNNPEYTHLQLTGGVCMAWHQMDEYNYMDQTDRLDTLLSSAEGLSVISPTWYSVINTNGEMTSFASSDYVARAHEAGLSVWVLVDNFNKELDNLSLLKNYSSRQMMIDRLVSDASVYGFDGINLDFEASGSGYGGLNAECGKHFLEFLRELSIRCRKEGLFLSVDNHVPATYNMYYDRKEQARVVDYIMLMAYDEHYAGSKEIGSVASYDFVKKGIEDTLKEVPASQLVLGVPFYTRLWSVVVANNEVQNIVSSEAKGMKQMEELISEKNIQLSKDEKTKQNYGFYDMDGLQVRFWLEDADSMAWKASMIREYDLAGAAAWKIGLETKDIWSVLQKGWRN